MILAKQLASIFMDARLIFARKVQVNIRHLVRIKAQKGRKRDRKTLFGQRLAAVRADLVRQAHPAANALIFMPFEIFALRAEIMRRERINLRNTAHERNQ